MGIKEGMSGYVALFGIPFSHTFCIVCRYSLVIINRYQVYALNLNQSRPRLPVLTPMSGSRGVVTLLAHISPACSTQPSISNVPPAPADNNFGHYIPCLHHRVSQLSQTLEWQRIGCSSDGLDGSILKDLSA